MLGLNMAVHSTIRTIAPTAGGAMMANLGYPSIGHLGMLCNMFVLILLFVPSISVSGGRTGIIYTFMHSTGGGK